MRSLLPLLCLLCLLSPLSATPLRDRLSKRPKPIRNGIAHVKERRHMRQDRRAAKHLVKPIETVSPPLAPKRVMPLIPPGAGLSTPCESGCDSQGCRPARTRLFSRRS